MESLSVLRKLECLEMRRRSDPIVSLRSEPKNDRIADSLSVDDVRSSDQAISQFFEKPEAAIIADRCRVDRCSLQEAQAQLYINGCVTG